LPCRLFCLSLLKAEKVAKRLILCLYYRGPYKGRIIVPWETESKAKDKQPWLRDPKILEKNLVTVDNSRVYQKNLNTVFPCLILTDLPHKN